MPKREDEVEHDEVEAEYSHTGNSDWKYGEPVPPEDTAASESVYKHDDSSAAEYFTGQLTLAGFSISTGLSKVVEVGGQRLIIPAGTVTLADINLRSLAEGDYSWLDGDDDPSRGDDGYCPF